MKIFDIKEKIGAFLLKEDGKISKKSILKAGIILGAFALSAGIASSGTSVNGNYNGDCPGVDARRHASPQGGEAIYYHTNAAHDNNVDVRNSFGKLTFDHDHCIETHANQS